MKDKVGKSPLQPHLVPTLRWGDINRCVNDLLRGVHITHFYRSPAQKTSSFYIDLMFYTIYLPGLITGAGMFFLKKTANQFYLINVTLRV